MKIDDPKAQSAALIAGLEKKPNVTWKAQDGARAVFINLLEMMLVVLKQMTLKTQSGEATFARMALACRVVNDLLAAHHLLQHAYVNQAYTQIRTAYEALEKLALFHEQPQWVKVWISGDWKEIQRELDPARVREKLGQEKWDPVYGLFSTLGAHAGFSGMRLFSAKDPKPSEKGHPQIRFWIGGCRMESQVTFGCSFFVHVAAKSVVGMVEVFAEYLEEKTAERMLVETAELCKNFNRQFFLPWAEENRLDVKDLKAELEADWIHT